MATFRHGKATQVLLNQYNLSSYLNAAATTITVDTGETTTFGASSKTYIVGLKDATITAEGLYEAVSTDAVDVVLNASINNTVDDVFTYAPEGLGTTAGRRAQIAWVEDTNYEVSGTVGDVVAIKASFQTDGGLDSGVVLAPGTAVTTATTTNGTGVDNAALTSNGGSANLRVTANTWTGTTVFKIQHSVDNTTYADLGSAFTTVAASTLTSERIIIAAGTTVNRYVRAVATTAAGSGSITYTIAFAQIRKSVV